MSFILYNLLMSSLLYPVRFLLRCIPIFSSLFPISVLLPDLVSITYVISLIASLITLETFLQLNMQFVSPD